MSRHASFFAKTVLVQNGNVEQACRILNRSVRKNNDYGLINIYNTLLFYRILSREGFIDQYRLTRYYEKPFQARRRLNFAKCKAIYNEDMDRKIAFVLRKNRVEPFPGYC
jgi:small subunit ribosomal protein S21